MPSDHLQLSHRTHLCPHMKVSRWVAQFSCLVPLATARRPSSISPHVAWGAAAFSFTFAGLMVPLKMEVRCSLDTCRNSAFRVYRTAARVYVGAFA